MYDNKTVIISCAGMGTRLGRNIPKALIEIDGKKLIIRTLEMLNECKDVRVVVGYKKEELIKVIKEYREDVKIYVNDDYMNNGAGASISLAVKNANEYIIAMVGDLIVKPADMKNILKKDGVFACLCEKSTDSPILATIEDNKIIKFSREEGTYEWTGICQMKTENFISGTGNIHGLFEKFLPADYMLLSAKEIDTPHDYDNAIRWLKNDFKED